MNDSRFSPDDPRLTAYALGELDPADAAQVEAALRRDPAARQIVDDIRATAQQLEAAFAADGGAPAIAGIAPVQSITSGRDYTVLELQYARKRAWGGLIEFPRFSYLLSGAAAAALIGFVLFSTPAFDPRVMQRQLSQERRARAIAEARNVALRDELAHYLKAEADAAVDASGLTRARGPRVTARERFQLPQPLQPKPAPIAADDYRAMSPTVGGVANLDNLTSRFAVVDLPTESAGEEDDMVTMDPTFAESDEALFAITNFARGRAPFPIMLANVIDWAKSSVSSTGDDPGGIGREFTSIVRRADGLMQ